MDHEERNHVEADYKRKGPKGEDSLLQRAKNAKLSGNTFASIYCPECAAEIKKEKTRDRVRKHRAKAKESAEE